MEFSEYSFIGLRCKSSLIKIKKYKPECEARDLPSRVRMCLVICILFTWWNFSLMICRRGKKNYVQAFKKKKQEEHGYFNISIIYVRVYEVKIF